jgi:two-component system, LytTR family, response regulator
MRACIVDDEESCIDSLKAKIDLFVPQLKVIKTFLLPQEALKEIPKMDIDVIFLDVEMPHLNGINFAKKLNSSEVEIIYTTAYQKYALDAFKVSAFDFLLKPVDRQELYKTVEKLSQKIGERSKSKLSRLNARFNKITVNTPKGMLFVPMHTILWIQSDNNYSTLHLDDGSSIITSRSIGDFEEMLTAFDFFRIHQSTLINLQHLIEYIRGDGGFVKLSNGKDLEVSRRRKPDLIAMLQ